MSARRAARRVVRAAARGEPFVTLSWQAKMLRIVHGAAPGVTTRLLGVANRLLPTDGNGMANTPGMHLVHPLGCLVD
jgi:hypothetical protein